MRRYLSAIGLIALSVLGALAATLGANVAASTGPSAPYDVRAAVGRTTIQISWRHRGHVTRYGVRYHRPSHPWTTVAVKLPHTHFRLSHLRLGAVRVLEVRACVHAACSRWTRPLRVVTGAPAPPPVSPSPPPPTTHPTTGTTTHATTTVATTTSTTTTTTTPVGQPPTIGGCSIFPADNPWNRDISHDPVDPSSDAYVATVGATAHFHPDFGSNPSYGIPFVVVPASQALVPVTFDNPEESDPSPYPIPPTAPVEGGTDGHVLVLQQGACKLYEMGNAVHHADGSWHAYSGAVFNLGSDALRPDGWTSADAAGLPILPGLVRYDEVASGVIRHALRMTVPTSQRGYIHPATHFASTDTDPAQPPMGLRLRLKASFDISHYHGEALVIAQAMKTYGVIVADNGAPWYVTGATDPRWNDDDLDQLKAIPGSAFEAVQSGPVIHAG